MPRHTPAGGSRRAGVRSGRRAVRLRRESGRGRRLSGLRSPRQSPVAAAPGQGPATSPLPGGCRCPGARPRRGRNAERAEPSPRPARGASRWRGGGPGAPALPAPAACGRGAPGRGRAAAAPRRKARRGHGHGPRRGSGGSAGSAGRRGCRAPPRPRDPGRERAAPVRAERSRAGVSPAQGQPQPRAAGRGRSPRRSARLCVFPGRAPSPCLALRPRRRGRQLRRLPPPGPSAASPGSRRAATSRMGPCFSSRTIGAPPLPAIFLGGHLQRLRGDFLPAGTKLSLLWLHTPRTARRGPGEGPPPGKSTRLGVRGWSASARSWGIEVRFLFLVALIFKLFKSYVVLFSAWSTTRKMEYCFSVIQNQL
ncbi:uncharacterized protein LOC141585371 [Saimiri boliviensis]|uniref:uncharacterized protein LOC141585371 n=1 Tax=Saimiri boliviensis TaxID=27679 RepID=UPI003D76DD1F